MKILFLSRAFPPILGGIENQNFALSVWLGKKASAKTIANRHGKSALPVFLPMVLLRLLFTPNQFDLLLLGDGVLAPIGAIIKFCYPRKTVVSVVHGLDLTFGTQSSFLGTLYRTINLPALQKLDGLIAVSEETKRLALSLGMESSRVFVIPNGIEPESIKTEPNPERLASLLGIDLTGKKVIVRIGRFVRHKGVAWFLQNVVPLLSNDIVFVAAGGVPQNAIPGDSNTFPECQQLVQELHLENRVRLLKNIPWSDIQVLLNTSDIAVAPNIPVAGSFEGFGIAALEAGACGLPIVAAKLEGLQEAIQDEKNGFLVPPADAEAFTKKIEWLLADESRRRTIGIHAAAFVAETYHWNILSERYLDLLADFRKSTLDTH